LRRDLDVGGSARATTGDGFTSGYFDLLASWYDSANALRVTAVPHAIIGSLVDEYGLRGTVSIPFLTCAFDLGGSVDRVYAVATSTWAGLAHVGASRSFYQRWRASLSAEVAAGDGPPRIFLFGLLGYRFGP
jgi:hypothetical protein